MREPFAGVGPGERDRTGRPGLLRSLKRRAVLTAYRFVRCARGVAAVEFAFIAPVMLVMLLGAVEATRAISIDRRLSVVTATVADLVSREEQLTAQDVNAIYDIVAQIMSPFDAGPLSVSIVPVKGRKGDTVSYVAPQNVPSFNGGAQPGKCQPVPIAAGLIDPAADAADSVIVVKASYAYRPMFVGMIMNSANWEEQSFAKPRKQSCVNFEGPDTCRSACP
ncbi:TadE/TadG family type IV pilus assembly protein [Hyphomicrobium sp.]|uniref:TadE/TadG family type IV pilus assembly protein n=1 Tax=Hyphomicrobium sp. TaxID=82 RepID=UPI002B74BE9F|nr:TadE/TadG family type IV pilus assembly protein [Hyphomicrobium sp.]HRN87324.1 pilus assembly protein [Hyphomicrobium sp.]HRQ26452.1 pilus assembly protein [Hyphomicrobium sp.]